MSLPTLHSEIWSERPDEIDLEVLHILDELDKLSERFEAEHSQKFTHRFNCILPKHWKMLFIFKGCKVEDFEGKTFIEKTIYPETNHRRILLNYMRLHFKNHEGSILPNYVAEAINLDKGFKFIPSHVPFTVEGLQNLFGWRPDDAFEFKRLSDEVIRNPKLSK